MKVYKVFVLHMDELYSFNWGPDAKPFFNDGKQSLHYRLNKRTKPTIKNSLLYAFRTLKSARRFCKNNHFYPVCICECEATGVEAPKKSLGYVYPAYYSIANFWSGKIDDSKCWPKSKAPGTVWCASIKPLRRIES